MILLKSRTNKRTKNLPTSIFFAVNWAAIQILFLWVGGDYNAEVSLFVEFSLGFTQSQVRAQQTELSSVPLTEKFFVSFK